MQPTAGRGSPHSGHSLDRRIERNCRRHGVLTLKVLDSIERSAQTASERPRSTTAGYRSTRCAAFRMPKRPSGLVAIATPCRPAPVSRRLAQATGSPSAVVLRWPPKVPPQRSRDGFPITRWSASALPCALGDGAPRSFLPNLSGLLEARGLRFNCLGRALTPGSLRHVYEHGPCRLVWWSGVAASSLQADRSRRARMQVSCNDPKATTVRR